METNCSETLCVLLAGGQGSRLYPLTADRAKPSVPFGGKYRIIDFTLSNCLHSGLRRVLVLTQYKSHSLQKHLRDGWSIFNPEMGEYITAVPPQMRTGDSWYRGTADAIYQNLYLLARSGARRVLILSGDHVYRMDYAAMIQSHIDENADLSIACMQVPRADAAAFGILQTDADRRVIGFQEKPSQAAAMPDDPSSALASMGIYVFNTEVLEEQLALDNDAADSSHDFGHDLIPRLIRSHRVQAYAFGGSSGRVSRDGYWRDVGTLSSYYQANLDLLAENPPLDLYQPSWPIRTYQGQHPPARVVPGQDGAQCVVRNAMLGNGAVVTGASVIDSILSARVTLASGARVEASILFDNVTVGPGACLRRCIVDKDVQIPAGLQVGFDRTADAARFSVSDDGIVVVTRDSLRDTVPDTRRRSLSREPQLST